MKYFFFLIAALLYLQPAFACRCLPLPQLDSLSQLKTYNFIARVVILDDGGDVKTGRDGQPAPGRLKIKVVELFKGAPRGEVYELAKGSSCDMYISTGQEWLLFGKMEKGKLSIGPCDRNMMYRNQTEGNDQLFSAAADVLKKLRELYKKPARA